MTGPCSIEQLENSAAALRALAIAAGQRLEFARINGAKMRQIWSLEGEHRAAWHRYYAVDSRLHEAFGTRRSE